MRKKLSLAVFIAFFSGLTPLTTAYASEYDLFTVKRERVSVHIAIAGTVSARKSVQLAAQIPGRIQYIAGQEGDRFQQGDLLVQIDDNALRAKLDAAVANRDAALAAIRNANMQLSRELYSPQSRASGQAPGGMGMPAMMDQMFTNPMQNMMGMRDRGAERSSDLVSRETQVTQATTQHKQAEAQIKEIQAALRDARSMAPFTGVVETVHVEVGDTVQPGQPILNYSETSGYQVEVDVPSRLRPDLQEGDILAVRLDGADPAINAMITRIFPVADPRQHTVRVEMDLPMKTIATVGQYAEVSVPDRKAQSVPNLVIPKKSVIRKGGLPLVYTVGSDGRTRLRVVRLGENLGIDQCVVLSGLREGDLIVNSPPPGMTAGVQVKEPATNP
ncbi:MAG: efflux RND transporter periplasmic adaptor subunit [Gammaproteobacteria bacterium]|nr:efflux RND transporter periplasmic adaptor subunit [Gammaproteobacteria bacterium]